MSPACEASEVLPHLTLPVPRSGCQHNDDAGRLILRSGGGDRADAPAAPLLGHTGLLLTRVEEIWTRKVLLSPKLQKIESAIKEETLHYFQRPLFPPVTS